MDQGETFNNYHRAFRAMRGHTELNTPFKLTFKKIDGSTKIITKALLRKQTPTNNDKNGAYKLNYIDVVGDRCGNCYIPLLMSVNDKKIILK